MGRVFSPIRLLEKARRWLSLAISLMASQTVLRRKASLASERECKSLVLLIYSPRRLAARPPQNKNSSLRWTPARQTDCGEIFLAMDPPGVIVNLYVQPYVGENRLHQLDALIPCGDRGGAENLHFGILLHHHVLRLAHILVGFREDAHKGKLFRGWLPLCLDAHVAADLAIASAHHLEAALSLRQPAVAPIHAQWNKNVERSRPHSHFNRIGLADHRNRAVGRSHHHAHERAACRALADRRGSTKWRELSVYQAKHLPKLSNTECTSL